MLDFNFIGSFAIDQIGQSFQDGECWESQWESGRRFLTDLRRAVGTACKITYIQGNHEQRTTRILLKDPTRRGSVEVPKHLDLERRSIQWVPFWDTGEVYQIGKMTYGHGWYATGNHAVKHLNDYGSNFTYGHTHTVQTYTKSFKSGDMGAVLARTVGCLCKRDMPYMRGRPSSWIQGFGITEFMPDGKFTSYEPIIIDGKFSFNGRTYKG